MRWFLFVVLAACGSDSPSGVLTLVPDSHTVIVGQSTFVHAFFNTGMGNPDAAVAVGASWSADPSGLVTLSDASGNYQKVTGVSVGQVVVTANAGGQTAKTGFTVMAP